MNVFLNLVKRNLKVISSSWFKTLVNTTLAMFFQAMLFCYFLPIMGLENNLVMPIFITTFIYFFSQIAYSRSTVLSGELEHGGILTYFVTLPTTKFWVMCASILSLVIEIIGTVLPIFLISKLILGNRLVLDQLQLVPLIIHIIVSLIFISTLVHTIAYATSLSWFLDCIWPRALAPMQVLGCIAYPWYTLKNISFILSYITLLSPYTYIAEGLRSAFFGQPKEFISYWICIPVLILITIFCLSLLNYLVKRRLDLV